MQFQMMKSTIIKQLYTNIPRRGEKKENMQWLVKNYENFKAKRIPKLAETIKDYCRNKHKE